MKVAQNDYFQQLIEMRNDEDARGLGVQLRQEGFTPVRRLLDRLRDYLRQFTDEEGEMALELLHYARTALPEPGQISPSWAHIWQEFERIIRTKMYTFRSIAVEEREGEWQVLLDNPHSNQNIAVYPALTFMEAIYLFAYFRTDMTRNEYIRLQKIATVMTVTGTDTDGL
ncbi:hypothetical protein Back11_12850 [Paenibacillus baekrokdamisoli]|uniref:Uncharacterized protein n=1 Tax=Paenibacillus baekrokdamisoli TaxID=1712516 RepID=A0A3G9IM77_9BACL|nr:hypothetical protein [Paenibacillus baekrokdamisoli]MBB3070589.1 hypothetical protein [Paenibacillus baekrokdamisoli]BBH19940.1 hypothetical protein Back11_12850 [Paenibacillus baekrokdamisoli]